MSLRHALLLLVTPLAVGALVLAACASSTPAGPAPAFTLPEAPAIRITPLPPLPAELPPEAAFPSVADPAREKPPAAQVALGKYLFFDDALSGDQKLNCATCHQPDRAWIDGLPLSVGYPGSLYFRNTPTLLNVGDKPLLYWDGRLDGNDLPTVIRDHIAEAHFMNADGLLVVERLNQKPQYAELFRAAYGGGPSYGRMLNAVAAYVGSLYSPPSAYDRYRAGEAEALSAQAQAGLALFEGKARCATCHSGTLFSDGQYHNLGLPQNPDIFDEPLRHITFRRFFRTLGVPDYSKLEVDVGRYALTQDNSDSGYFLTPALREVGRTAPYMHNGIFVTLEEVVAFYNAGGGESSELSPLNLTPAEQAALVAFLENLSGELVSVEPPEAPAYQLTILGGDQ